jgi:dynamin 1-like protein
VDKLSTVLFRHIKNYLPKIMEEIDSKVSECDDKLRRLGPTLPNDQKERM